MDQHLVTQTIAARLDAHAGRVERHPFARTPQATLAVLLDILDALGWTQDRFLDPDPQMPRSEDCIGLATHNKTPHMLLVGQPAGRVGTDPEMHEAARAAGFPFLVGTDTKTWTFVDLETDRMLSLKDMINGPEVARGLAALSSGPFATHAFGSLVAYAHVLEYAETAAAAFLRDHRDGLIPYMMEIAEARGERLDEGRVRSLLASAILPLDALLASEEDIPAPSPDAMLPVPGAASSPLSMKFLTGRTPSEIANDDAAAPDAEPVPSRQDQQDLDIKGLVFGPPPKSRLGRQFELVAVTCRSVILRAGSKIAWEVVLPEEGEPDADVARFAKTHEDVARRGKAIEAVDANGNPCLELTRDVGGLKPSKALNAIHGNSRNAGRSLYCMETGRFFADYTSSNASLKARAA